MTASLIWNNLLVYSLQLGLLVGLAAFVPSLLRLRIPAGRLAYLQILLGACLLLPVLQPWRQAAAGGSVEITTSLGVARESAASAAWRIPWVPVALALVAAGIVIRLAWLGIGMLRLRRLHRHATPLSLGERVPTLLSGDISSPVTFGFFRPVVLLPARFPDLDPAMQRAILCHEFLHIERGDWIFTVAEELVRGLFWFHPAIWWLLAEIQLAREEAVDRATVERTRAREPYIDALLAVASGNIQPDLAPAPLFLKRRHLKHRVASIFQEVHMTKTGLFSRLAAGLTMMIAAGWLVTGTLPLTAQDVKDAPGVTVDLGGARLLHRAPVAYPQSAQTKGVQGVVTVEATLDASGDVRDARVLSGPDELRNPALDSVLRWHFADGSAGATRQINIAFQLPDQKPGSPLVRSNFARLVDGRTLKSISVTGLSDQSRADLMSRLPVREGVILTQDQLGRLEQAVHEFDEHLRLVWMTDIANEARLEIRTPSAPPPPPPPAAPAALAAGTTQRLRIGGNVQQTKLVSQVRPVYPPDAKLQRVQGVVQLSAVIAKDGTIQTLEVISGDPLLVPSALEAVRQWRYQPTLLNGNPVEVITQIDINYTLSQ